MTGVSEKFGMGVEGGSCKSSEEGAPICQEA
jgi:hypothetical protein